MRKLLSVFFVLITLSCTTAPPPRATSQPLTDRDAVETVVRNFESTWNRHDMADFAELFTDDADFVNVVGMRWIGRAAIKDAHEASHASMFKNSQLSFLDTTIRFVKPDVAVARSRWRLTGHTTPTGEAAAPRQGFLTHVLTRSEGEWRIVFSQNTDIMVPGA